MRILLSLALLCAPTFALADPIQCTATTHMNGETRSAPVVINYDEGYVTVGPNRETIRARTEGKLVGIKEYLAAEKECAKLPEDGVAPGSRMDCSRKAMEGLRLSDSGNNRLLSMAGMGVVFLQINLSAPEGEERMVDIDFDLGRIDSAKVAQIGEDSKFGIPSAIEYFDESGALLGRFLIATPYIIPCK